jgi:hypothetical protein
MFELLDKIEGASPTSGRFNNIADFFAIIFNVMFGIGLSLSVIGIILAGIKYLTARSDIKATAEAKSALTYSIMALILVLGAFTIYTIIVNLLNADGGTQYVDTPSTTTPRI